MENLNKKQEDDVLEEARELSYLEKVQNTKKEIEELMGKADKAIQELRELKTEEILSGKTNAGQAPAEPKEETPAEYRKRIEEEIKIGKRR